MSAKHRSIPTAAWAASLSLAVVGSVAFGAFPALAETPPGLSVTVNNGVDETAPDSDVKYETVLTNAGTDPVVATVVVTVPSFGQVLDAPDAVVDGVNATWVITVEPGSSKSLSTSAHIGDIPKGEYRVTTLASVYLGDGVTAAPVIRSADSDKIPGVVDPVISSPDDASESEEAVTDEEWVLPTVIVVAIVLLLVIAVLVTLRVRARRDRAAASDEDLTEPRNEGESRETQFGKES